MNIWEAESDTFSKGKYPPEGKKRSKMSLVTMTNHSLLKCPSFIEGIYNAIFHLHACIYVALSPFLLFNLAPALTPPKLSIISHLLSFFPPTEAPSFIHSRTPLFFSATEDTGIPQENKPGKSMLPWGQVSMAWKRTVANKTILPD